MVSRRRKQIDILVLITVLLGGAFAVKNAQSIGDYWHMLTYKPNPAIVQLADAAGMNVEGKRLFYRFSPQLVDKSEILDKCGAKLGCASGRNIYILKTDDDTAVNSETVTAAHEMLHIAYSRLTSSEKSEIDGLLQSELDSGRHKNTENEIYFYKRRGLDYLNETHSYIGSEESNLAPNLENYYKRYFSNRQKVIDAYRASPESRY